MAEQKEFEKSEIFRFNEEVDYIEGGIASRNIIKKPAGNISLFAFDKGEGLSEHTAPFDALVFVTEGNAEITIDKKVFNLQSGDSLIMPANIPHALKAKEKFKMVLTMIKEKEDKKNSDS